MRWRSAAITRSGKPISISSRSLASAFSATVRRIHHTLLGAGKYDWSFADLTFCDLQKREHRP